MAHFNGISFNSNRAAARQASFVSGMSGVADFNPALGMMPLFEMGSNNNLGAAAPFNPAAAFGMSGGGNDPTMAATAAGLDAFGGNAFMPTHSVPAGVAPFNPAAAFGLFGGGNDPMMAAAAAGLNAFAAGAFMPAPSSPIAQSAPVAAAPCMHSWRQQQQGPSMPDVHVQGGNNRFQAGVHVGQDRLGAMFGNRKFAFGFDVATGQPATPVAAAQEVCAHCGVRRGVNTPPIFG